MDDQIELAENIAEVLAGVGFQTDVAASAEAGIAIIRKGGVTALITDFKLPGRSGVELIGELRRAGERIPALVMSAYTDDRTIEASVGAGAWFFLPKPVPLEALMRVSPQFLGEHAHLLECTTSSRSSTSASVNARSASRKVRMASSYTECRRRTAAARRRAAIYA